MIAWSLDLVRSVAAAGSLVVAGWLSVGIRPVTPVIAQALGLPTNPPTETLFEFAIRQGGAFAILALVLFFYRRDWRDLTDYKGSRDTVLTGLVAEHTKAMTEMAAALRENNVVIHQAKNVLAAQVGPARRLGDVPNTGATP